MNINLEEEDDKNQVLLKFVRRTDLNHTLYIPHNNQMAFLSQYLTI